jgi:hypothetical protein
MGLSGASVRCPVSFLAMERCGLFGVEPELTRTSSAIKPTQQICDLRRHFLFDDAVIHLPHFVTYTNSDSTSDTGVNIIRTDWPFKKRIPHGTNSIRMPPRLLANYR